MVVIDRGDVMRAKPEPDLFLPARSGWAWRSRSATWSATRLGPAGGSAGGHASVGLLTGGYGEDELARAGAFRVYRDAEELHRRSTSWVVP